MCFVSDERMAEFEREYPKKLEQIKIDAANGDIWSMCRLAWEYRMGVFVEENFEKAIELYERAIIKGHLQAYVGLAETYMGMPGEENKLKGIKLLEEAMRFGDRELFRKAVYSLGYFLAIPYMIKSEGSGFYSRRKAAYCLFLSCMLGNNYSGECLGEIDYQISEYEYKLWREDALNLNYCYRETED